jgi:hypothetical protein
MKDAGQLFQLWSQLEGRGTDKIKVQGARIEERLDIQQHIGIVMCGQEGLASMEGLMSGGFQRLLQPSILGRSGPQDGAIGR